MAYVRLVDGRTALDHDVEQGTDAGISGPEFEVPTEPGERVVSVRLTYIGRVRDGDPQVICWTATVVGGET